MGSRDLLAQAALRRRWAVVIVATLLALLASVLTSGPVVANPSSAQNDTPRRATVLTGWLPYWTIADSTQRFAANADLFADVSPFWLTVRQGAGGGLTPTLDVSETQHAQAMQQLRAAGRPIIPSIVDGTSARYMAAALADPVQRTRHVDQLMYIVMANGYDGIDLDYEKFAFNDGQSTWATTRPNWVAFVSELSERLRKADKLLTVAIPFSGYWVYDHAAMGRLTDGVRIMTYDWSVSKPGPIAPMWWLRQEISTLSTVIPSSKLYLGVPLYGRDWVRRDANNKPLIVDAQGRPATEAACPTGSAAPSFATNVVTAKNVTSHLVRPGVTVTAKELVANADEWKVEYTQRYSAGGKTCGVLHEAWLTDENTVANRVRVIVESGAAGAALWAIGFEDASQWPLLRAIAQSADIPAAPVPAGRHVKIATGAPNQTVFGTLSAVTPQANGYLTAWTCGQPQPVSSSLNYQAGRTTPNTIAVRADSNGDICVRTKATTHILFDKVADTDAVQAGPPQRIRDTGLDTLATHGREGLVPARGTIEIDTGHPNSVVMGVLTVSSPQANGFTSVRPCVEPPTETSINNYVAMRDNANFAVMPTDAAGKICVTTTAAARLIWDQVVATTAITATLPIRVADSRRNDGPPVPAGMVWEVTVGTPGQTIFGNLTVASPNRAMITTLYPCSATRPAASHNFVYAGDTTPTYGLVRANEQGKICVFTSADTHLVWDQSAATPLIAAHDPDRRLDSRQQRVW